MNIKPELTGNRVMECLKLKIKIEDPTLSAATMSISFIRACLLKQKKCQIPYNLVHVYASYRNRGNIYCAEKYTLLLFKLCLQYQ